MLLRLANVAHNLKKEFVSFLFYEASVKTLDVNILHHDNCEMGTNH